MQIGEFLGESRNGFQMRDFRAKPLPFRKQSFEVDAAFSHGRPLHLDPFFAGPNHGVPNATANCIGSQISKGFNGSSKVQVELPVSKVTPTKSGPALSTNSFNSRLCRSPAWFSMARRIPRSRATGRILFRATSVLSTCLSMPPGPFRSFIEPR